MASLGGLGVNGARGSKVIPSIAVPSIPLFDVSTARDSDVLYSGRDESLCQQFRHS